MVQFTMPNFVGKHQEDLYLDKIVEEPRSIDKLEEHQKNYRLLGENFDKGI